MTQPTPTQELVAKDLHGIEWKFKHIYRGNLKPYFLSLIFVAYTNSGMDKYFYDDQVNRGGTCLQLAGVHLSPLKDWWLEMLLFS
jgi:hypothetical protein